MDFEITVSVEAREGAGVFLAPRGLSTPHAFSLGCAVEGGFSRFALEATTDQPVLLVVPTAGVVTFRYTYRAAEGCYPEAMFEHRENRFTRAADALLAETQAIAPGAPPLERAVAIARATAEKFTYGHPETRFNDGLDEIPALGCGMTAGSCVDINTYFVASLRAAGIRTGYVTGYFFPVEKGDTCNDMHCWVVTKIDGAYQEWDIAHFLKMGRKDIHAALNPKPGFRAAIAHSMGLDFPELGLTEQKLLGEPVWVPEGGAPEPMEPDIRLHHAAVVAPAQPVEA